MTLISEFDHSPGDGTDTSLWNIIETNVSVLCACIIIIKPALKKLVVEGLILSTWSMLTKWRSSEQLLSHSPDPKQDAAGVAKRTAQVEGEYDNDRHAIPFTNHTEVREGRSVIGEKYSTLTSHHGFTLFHQNRGIIYYYAILRAFLIKLM